MHNYRATNKVVSVNKNLKSLCKSQRLVTSAAVIQAVIFADVTSLWLFHKLLRFSFTMTNTPLVIIYGLLTLVITLVVTEPSS